MGDDDDDDDTDDDEKKEKKKEILRKPSKEQQIQHAKDKTPAIQIRDRFKRVRVSVWPSVVAINEQLKRFCEKHKHVSFFDAYDIFVDPTGGSDESNDIPILKEEYYKSYLSGMPSAEGHKAWLDAVVKKLNYIFQKKDKDGED